MLVKDRSSRFKFHRDPQWAKKNNNWIIVVYLQILTGTTLAQHLEGFFSYFNQTWEKIPEQKQWEAFPKEILLVSLVQEYIHKKIYRGADFLNIM